MDSPARTLQLVEDCIASRGKRLSFPPVLEQQFESDHYQYFVLLVLLFSNLVQRCPFWYALAASSVIVGVHAPAVLLHPDLALASALLTILILVTAAYLTLTSGYYIERDFRRGYL